jgi:hypothetical protein
VNTQERRHRDEQEWSRLSGQKTHARIVITIGVVILISDYFETINPGMALETIALAAIIGGGFWYYWLKQEMNRIAGRDKH